MPNLCDLSQLCNRLSKNNTKKLSNGKNKASVGLGKLVPNQLTLYAKNDVLFSLKHLLSRHIRLQHFYIT